MKIHDHIFQALVHLDSGRRADACTALVEAAGMLAEGLPGGTPGADCPAPGGFRLVRPIHHVPRREGSHR